MHEDAVVQEILEGPKPIAIEISTQDIRMLFACHTSPTAYQQLLLAKLKDAGAPVEGTLNLRLAHGKLYKMRTDPLRNKTRSPIFGFPRRTWPVWKVCQRGDHAKEKEKREESSANQSTDAHHHLS